jgi:hypothetical protein
LVVFCAGTGYVIKEWSVDRQQVLSRWSVGLSWGVARSVVVVKEVVMAGKNSRFQVNSYSK